MNCGENGIRRCPGFRHCQSMLDVFGDHLASCPSTDRLKRRGTAFERVYHPLWKESTTREREQPFVTELIWDADPTDSRQSDVELRGLSLGRGLPVVGDMCMGSALHADGCFLFGRAISVFSERFFNRLRPKKKEKINEIEAHSFFEN